MAMFYIILKKECGYIFYLQGSAVKALKVKERIDLRLRHYKKEDYQGILE